MKTWQTTLFSLACVVGLPTLAVAWADNSGPDQLAVSSAAAVAAQTQPAAPGDPEPPEPPPQEPVPPPEPVPPDEPANEGPDQPVPADGEGMVEEALAPPEEIPADDQPPTEAVPFEAMPVEPAPGDTVPVKKTPAEAAQAKKGPTPITPSTFASGRELADDEKVLRLNFRGAPLEMVLNYLSEAAGFIIVPEVDVKGKIDVWSNQPLTKLEALDILNSVLNKNGYAALRNGRTLTIVTREVAKTRDIPVKTGGDPQKIPRNDEIVTQIIPVRYINAVQVSRDLQQLLPEKATLSANEGGNALVLTDTQTSIRRMTEIIKALDTALSTVSSVRVFPLQYADAKALATVIKELFAQQDTSRNNQGGNRFMNFFRGPGGPGGGPGGEGGRDGGNSSGGRAPTPRVVAVADERSNSVVVSAPEEQMPIIEELVSKVDTNVEDVTELRVFRLRYADPQETADLIAELFPDPTTGQSSRSQGQFGGRRFGGFFGPPGMNPNATGEQSSRTLKASRVLAVPDLRTGSVVVSAARDMMLEIAQMISELDSDPAKKQRVHVFSVENTDPQAVEEILRGLFEGQNARNRGTTSRNTSRQTGSQLNNRSSTTRNQSNTGSGFGGGSSFGGGNSGRIGQ